MDEKKYKILVADDNEELCRNLGDILEFKGYNVTLVFDGSKAIEAVKKEKFNVILMDVKMPGISGIDTLKILKQITPDISVIVITAFADDILYKEGLIKSDCEILQKPMDIDKLLSRIEEIVTQKNKTSGQK